MLVGVDARLLPHCLCSSSFLGRTHIAKRWDTRVVQTMRMLAGKIRDEELRESFLSAPRVRRVLGHH